jgi:hypothetical protein
MKALEASTIREDHEDTKTEDKCRFKKEAVEATEVRDLQTQARNDLRLSSVP